MAFLELGWHTRNDEKPFSSLTIHKLFLKVSICAVNSQQRITISLSFQNNAIFLYLVAVFSTTLGWNTEEVFHLPSQTTPLRSLPLEDGCHPPVKAVLFHTKGYKVYGARRRNRTRVWPWSKPQGSLQAQSRSLERKSVSSYQNYQILLLLILQSCSKCRICKFFMQS